MKKPSTKISAIMNQMSLFTPPGSHSNMPHDQLLAVQAAEGQREDLRHHQDEHHDGGDLGRLQRHVP